MLKAIALGFSVYKNYPNAFAFLTEKALVWRRFCGGRLPQRIFIQST
ncbi:hypothetical protein ACG2K1_00580 [Neisseria sp. 23W00296]